MTRFQVWLCVLDAFVCMGNYVELVGVISKFLHNIPIQSSRVKRSALTT